MQNRYNQLFPLIVIAVFVLLSCHLTRSSTAQQQKSAASTKQDKPKLPRITSHVVLISINGLRADHANDPSAFRLKIPNIQLLRSRGSHAYGVESVYPSQSYPAHITIVTGVLPADHGITSDYPFDERTGMPVATPHRMADEIKADTIWAAAKRRELTTAAVGYPVTADALINFNLPVVPDGNQDILSSTEARKYSIPPGLYDEVLAAWKSKSELINSDHKSRNILQSSDIFKAEAAGYLIGKYRPNLLLINFTTYDQIQRRFGLLSTEAIGSLELLDGLVGKIIEAIEHAGILGDTSFLIISDHGSSKVEKEFRPNVLLARNQLLTTDDNGSVNSYRAVAQSFGGSAAIFLNNPNDTAALRQIEKIFGELERDSDNALWRITSRRDATKLGSDARAILYLDAAPLYMFSGRASGSTTAKTDDRATHGYLPSRAEMRAALIIAGRGIKSNQRVEYARLIDIAPTVAFLLGLEMKTTRGRLLSEVIAQ